MDSRWIMVIDSYDGLYKQAANTLSGTISGYLSYVLPVKLLSTVRDDTLSNHNVIVIGCVESNRLLQACQTQKLLNVPQQAEKVLRAAGVQRITEIRGGGQDEAV